MHMATSPAAYIFHHRAVHVWLIHGKTATEKGQRNIGQLENWATEKGSIGKKTTPIKPQKKMATVWLKSRTKVPLCTLANSMSCLCIGLQSPRPSDIIPSTLHSCLWSYCNWTVYNSQHTSLVTVCSTHHAPPLTVHYYQWRRSWISHWLITH